MDVPRAVQLPAGEVLSRRGSEVSQQVAAASPAFLAAQATFNSQMADMLTLFERLAKVKHVVELWASNRFPR